MRKVVLAFSLLLVLSLIPVTVHAEDVSDPCSSICHSYDPCDTACEICDSFNPQTNSCEHWAYSTCGDATYGECGGCATVSTWQVTEEISRQPVGGYVCGHEYEWYGDNPSVFLQYTKHMRRTTYGHQNCNGVVTTVLLSTYYFDDTCYQFVYPDCCDWVSDGNCHAPPYGGPITFDSYMECH